MRTVIVFSVLLIGGLVASQWLPALLGDWHALVAEVIQVLTMVALSFIMIHVGYEFDIDKSRLGQYGWDYVVAMTAAAFPWLFCSMYFVLVMMPEGWWGLWPAWKESLLAARFASPTSAGVLFAMLAAAGLGATWLFRKARILAIFDDLDTVLLMIPLKMLMIGLAWQLGIILVVMAVMLWLAWRYLHAWHIPLSWPWVLGYSTAIALLSEVVYVGSRLIAYDVPIHIEVLLPAFVLGCMIARPEGAPGDEELPGHHEELESPAEKRATTIVASIFMVLVGLSLPPIFDTAPSPAAAEMQPGLDADQGGDEETPPTRLTASMPSPAWSVIAWHVLVITFLSNLGKMFPALCYRREAPWRERLAVAIGLWPRGEVGAGVLIVSLSYGLGGPVVTVAMLSLALNLVLTGVFIAMVKALITKVPAMAQ